jgi:hypothetical protein
MSPVYFPKLVSCVCTPLNCFHNRVIFAAAFLTRGCRRACRTSCFPSSWPKPTRASEPPSPSIPAHTHADRAGPRRRRRLPACAHCPSDSARRSPRPVTVPQALQRTLQRALQRALQRVLQQALHKALHSSQCRNGPCIGHTAPPWPVPSHFHSDPRISKSVAFGSGEGRSVRLRMAVAYVSFTGINITRLIFRAK